jgi:16S rRNA (cytosine1407-C5)-methyltransferase
LEAYQALLQELASPLDPSLRVNTLKIDTNELLWRLSRLYGYRFRRTPFDPNGFWVEAGDTLPSQTIEHKLGFYYLPEAASMLPAALFDFSNLPEPIVLDMAASPGGKTTQIGDHTKDHGVILANDANSQRIPALRVVLRDYGLINNAISRLPGETFGRLWPESFDAVLIDAPCSMENLRDRPAHRQRATSGAERKGLAARQEALLSAALSAAKLGGQVVYSTCSLAPEEDEAVVDAVLRRFPSSVHLENAQHYLPVAAPGLGSYLGNDFAPELRGTLRLWPQLYHTSGFFAAKFIKTSSLPTSAPGASPSLRFLQDFTPLNRAQSQSFATRLTDLYGLDLDSLLQEQRLELWARGGQLFAFPAAFLESLQSVPVVSLGMLIAQLAGSQWVPSHEFVSRFGSHFQAGRTVLPDDLVGPWVGGQSLPLELGDHFPEEQVVAVFDPEGRLLGRGKVLRGQLKNLLPRRLV